jgi:Helix-turn-helix domain
MILAHKIALVPTRAQAAHLARACGVARFASDWFSDADRRNTHCGAGIGGEQGGTRRRCESERFVHP